VVALNQSFGVLLVYLGNNSMHIGGPFISPRTKTIIPSLFGRPWLPSVRGYTGLSGAHQAVNNVRFLSIPAMPTIELVVASFGCLAHWTDLWRIGQSGGAPDSPVLPRVRL
jgi:hypothetical protein